jgi:hypothetical protein
LGAAAITAFELDPANLATQVDNPYWPMSPGARWIYGETDTEGSEQRVVVEVTGETKTIANGVEALVVQEYYEGEAEDRAAIVSVGEEQVQAPAGHFPDVLMTRDLVPLEPRVEELKFYAPGVGPVMAVAISGGAPGFEELVEYRPGG